MAKSKKRNNSKKKINNINADRIKSVKTEVVQNDKNSRKMWIRVVMLLIACAILISIIAMPVMGLYGYL